MQLRDVKRTVRTRRKQVVKFVRSADRGVERNFFKRFHRLRPVRRFVFGWAALMLLLVGISIIQFQHLSGFYQQLQPVPGGIYTEGMLGSISNVNPIYAQSGVDRSLSRLLFSGLMTYGADGKLTNDLASGITVSPNNRMYTVTLKPDLVWQDGKPLTSADVLYTFSTIKDPDAKSPLLSSWQNVQVTAPDNKTVRFTLPSPLASFPYSLTTGIIPQHILSKTSAANLRSADFNTIAPVGSGPFKWRGLQVNGSDTANSQEQVALVPFSRYALGAPKLSEFIVRSYSTMDTLSQAYRSGQLTAAADLTTPPAVVPGDNQRHDLLLNAGTYVFYKTTSPALGEVAVRQALNAAVQTPDIVTSLGYKTRPVTQPLLLGQLGYNKQFSQQTGDISRAKNLLAQAGYTVDGAGRAVKNGKQLHFSFVAADTPEYRQVTDRLRRHWQAIGVRADVQLLSGADYSTALAAHDYDATLYGISIGQDPDVYAYWDGTQADVRATNRLNLSEWNNAAANSALEAGRTRLDPAIRAIKYAPFLQAWQQDAPALGLYQPAYLYLTRGPVYGLTDRAINDSVDRYNGVQDWQIRQAKVTTL